MNPLTLILDLLRKFLEQEPARLIAWGGAGALLLARWALQQLGIEIPQEVADAITLIGGFLLIELIRRVVYAPATVEAIQNENADA